MKRPWMLLAILGEKLNYTVTMWPLPWCFPWRWVTLYLAPIAFVTFPTINTESVTGKLLESQAHVHGVFGDMFALHTLHVCCGIYQQNNCQKVWSSSCICSHPHLTHYLFLVGRRLLPSTPKLTALCSLLENKTGKRDVLSSPLSQGHKK